MEESDFDNFKKRVCNFLKVDDVHQLDSFCWEMIHDIVEGDEDYEVDFEEIRLTSDFLMAAVLLSKFHDKWVYVIEPTAFYSYQAIKMFTGWKLDVPKLSICTSANFDPAYADVVFHHGRRYPLKYNSSKVRTVVQIFDKEDVPDDNRTLSALICATHCDD